MIQVVNSRYSSLILNHHSVAKRIISLTLTLLKSYFFNTHSVDLTLGVLLYIYIYIYCDIPGQVDGSPAAG